MFLFLFSTLASVIKTSWHVVIPKMTHTPSSLWCFFLFWLRCFALAMCVFESKFHFISSFDFISPAATPGHQLPPSQILSFTFIWVKDTRRRGSHSFFLWLSARWKECSLRRWTFSFLVKRTNFNFTSARFQIYISTRCCVVNYMCMAIWQLHSPLAAHL